MASTIFDLAAAACGYDTRLDTDTERARHDHRVWDLAEQYQAELNSAAGEAIARDGVGARS